jgi:hypothetical protein
MTVSDRHHSTGLRGDSAKGSSIMSSFTIRYRRPEVPWSVVKMTVPNGEEATEIQRARLEALGYSVIDVTSSIPPTMRRSLSA